MDADTGINDIMKYIENSYFILFIKQQQQQKIGFRSHAGRRSSVGTNILAEVHSHAPVAFLSWQRIAALKLMEFYM